MDPIANLLTTIKNAQAVKKQTVTVPFSNLKFELLEILKREGYIENYKKKGRPPKRRIIINLEYHNNEPVIHGVKLISKPSRRIYLKRKKLYLPKSGYGLLILSTSKGLMSSKEAKRNNLGGEIICEIW